MAGRDSHPQQQAGDRPDFQRLVDLHYASLFRFALSLTRSESDAGDLVQGTFLTWATKGHQLIEAAKVKAWLFTTLHRRFLERERHTTRFPHVELAGVGEELPVIDPDLIHRLDGRAVVELLARLEPEFRSPVALFYLEDYAYREIAAILEIPLGTVKSRIARGLARLRILVRDSQTAPQRAGEKTS